MIVVNPGASDAAFNAVMEPAFRAVMMEIVAGLQAPWLASRAAWPEVEMAYFDLSAEGARPISPKNLKLIKREQTLALELSYAPQPMTRLTPEQRPTQFLASLATAYEMACEKYSRDPGPLLDALRSLAATPAIAAGETDAADEEDDGGGDGPDGDLLLYRDDRFVSAWLEHDDDGGIVVRHVQGRVGDANGVQQKRFRDSRKAYAHLDSIESRAVADGFEPLDEDDWLDLVVTRKVEGFGTEAERGERHRLEDRIGEALAMRGYGTCDGGNAGSGTLEIECTVCASEAVELVQAVLVDTDWAAATIRLDTD